MFRLLMLVLLISSCAKEDTVKKTVERQRKTVKVAALQYYSRMGDKEYNWQLFKKLAQKAVEAEAKIIVLPEAAVTGYMNPAKDITWTTAKESEYELRIQGKAETVDGDFIKKYIALADELNVYLSIPFVEEDTGKYYNSVILSSPDGEVLIHHRKKSLWTHGDSGWCEEGNLKPEIVETTYGRLGLMICYDVHSMPEKLSELKADIVLYSVGWFGPNTEDWYKRRFPNRYVIPNNFAAFVSAWGNYLRHGLILVKSSFAVSI